MKKRHKDHRLRLASGALIEKMTGQRFIALHESNRSRIGGNGFGHSQELAAEG